MYVYRKAHSSQPYYGYIHTVATAKNHIIKYASTYVSLSALLLNSRNRHEKNGYQIYSPRNTPLQKLYLRKAN